MQQNQCNTASNQVFPGLYVPACATESLRYAVKRGSFDFSAIAELPDGHDALITGAFKRNKIVVGSITGYIENSALEETLPLEFLLAANERQTCELFAVSVSNAIGIESALHEIASAARVAEIEGMILDAIRG